MPWWASFIIPTIKNFFVGLFPILTHFGIAGVTALILGAIYFTAPSWLAPRFQKIIPWIVLAIVVYLTGLTIGVKDEAARCSAQRLAEQQAEVELGVGARSEATSSIPIVQPPPAGSVRNKRLDKYDRGQ